MLHSPPWARESRHLIPRVVAHAHSRRPLGGDTVGDVSIERQGRRKGRQRPKWQVVAAVGRFPWERDATRFKRTAHVFTRLFQEAMENNKLHVARAARAM
jgi:hypothetical protein